VVICIRANPQKANQTQFQMQEQPDDPTIRCKGIDAGLQNSRNKIRSDEHPAAAGRLESAKLTRSKTSL
jgi:hypothetical protein